MKSINFKKYEGAGNDFIVIDNRTLQLPHHLSEIYKKWCDRNFGIGADGILLLENHDQYDFEMIYLNADGKISSMCGNGGRCIAHFANELKIAENNCTFYAMDGEHKAIINDNKVKLKMLVYNNIEQYENAYLVETGSPHYVNFTKNIDDFDLIKKAQAIRYNETFKAKGINVNFAELTESGLKMRTYERGVENETLACGTGTVAVAMAAKKHFKQFENTNEFEINTKGGTLKIYFENDGVWLYGDATFVFSGTINLQEELLV